MYCTGCKRYLIYCACPSGTSSNALQGCQGAVRTALALTPVRPIRDASNAASAARRDTPSNALQGQGEVSKSSLGLAMASRAKASLGVRRIPIYIGKIVGHFALCQIGHMCQNGHRSNRTRHTVSRRTGHTPSASRPRGRAALSRRSIPMRAMRSHVLRPRQGCNKASTLAFSAKSITFIQSYANMRQLGATVDVN